MNVTSFALLCHRDLELSFNRLGCFNERKEDEREREKEEKSEWWKRHVGELERARERAR